MLTTAAHGMLDRVGARCLLGRDRCPPLAQDVTSAEKLVQWQAARPGRIVGKPERVNVNAVAFACDCSEAGALVVRGQGPTAEAALTDACNQLWRLALEAAGAESNWRPKRRT
jgi:hypothetical protein